MKKSKIFLIITNLVLCLCAIFVGVWAIGKPSAKVNSNGTVTFSGRGINASVSGKIYGYAQSGDLNQVVAEQNGITLETLVFNPSASDASGTDSDKSSWTTSRDLKFSYNGDPITIKFTITNNLNVAPIYAKIIDQTFGKNQDLTYRIIHDETETSTSTLENLATINSGESTTFRVIISPTNYKNAFTLNYNLFVKLSATELKAVGTEDLYQDSTVVTGNASYTQDWYVNIGKFPQRFVNDNPKTIIPNNAVATSNYINLSNTLEYDSVTYSSRSPEYQIFYDSITGREFVFVEKIITFNNKNNKYSDGSVAKNFGYGWFELQPIKWLVLGYYNLNADGSYVSTITQNWQTGKDLLTYSFVGRFNDDESNKSSFNPKQNNIGLSLISNSLLTAMSFNDTSVSSTGAWNGSTRGTSSIRTWLNGTDQDNSSSFLAQAFNSSEYNQLMYGNDVAKAYSSTSNNIVISDINDYQSGVNINYYHFQNTEKDKVWMLSPMECQRKSAWGPGTLGGSYGSGKSKSSDFCLAHSSGTETYDGYGNWWTRSGGADTNLAHDIVLSNNTISYCSTGTYQTNVRPAINIKL